MRILLSLLFVSHSYAQWCFNPLPHIQELLRIGKDSVRTVRLVGSVGGNLGPLHGEGMVFYGKNLETQTLDQWPSYRVSAGFDKIKLSHRKAPFTMPVVHLAYDQELGNYGKFTTYTDQTGTSLILVFGPNIEGVGKIQGGLQVGIKGRLPTRREIYNFYQTARALTEEEIEEELEEFFDFDEDESETEYFDALEDLPDHQ